MENNKKERIVVACFLGIAVLVIFCFVILCIGYSPKSSTESIYDSRKNTECKVEYLEEFDRYDVTFHNEGDGFEYTIKKKVKKCDMKVVYVTMDTDYICIVKCTYIKTLFDWNREEIKGTLYLKI